MSRHVLTELGVQLGLCDPASPQTHQLAHDYFTVTQTMKEKQKGEEGGRCWTEVSRRPQRPAPLICLMHVERVCCAVQMLSVRPHCTLRRFLLTLLALPTSLCRQQVFAKVSVSCVSGCFQVVAHPILNTMFQEHHGGNASHVGTNLSDCSEVNITVTWGHLVQERSCVTRSPRNLVLLSLHSGTLMVRGRRGRVLSERPQSEMTDYCRLTTWPVVLLIIW